jgi:galactokinase
VTIAPPVRQATSLFQERFGSRPTVVVSAPGRVNLLGEHTDYNGGPVLPFALEQRTVVAVGPADSWRAVSTLDPEVRDLNPDLIERGHWTAYLSGALRVLRQRGMAPKGAALAVASSVPAGSGLSSSAALTVSVVRGLANLAGHRIPPELVADLAYHAEHDEVGVRCGRMDQTVSARARADHALLFETGTGEVQHHPMPWLVWLFDTGVRHHLSSGALNERRQECEVALGLAREQGSEAESLAAIPEAEISGLLRSIPSPWGRRLRHVVTETGRTRRAARALAARDLPTLGRLLVEGHESLRHDFQSTCPEADHLVEGAVALGAFGARLTGAGWGGVVIALLPPEQEDRIAAELGVRFQATYGRLPQTWVTRAGPGLRSEK